MLEPLSPSLPLIIVLSVTPSLWPYPSFYYVLHLIVSDLAGPLRFVRSSSAFHIYLVVRSGQHIAPILPQHFPLISDAIAPAVP